MGLLRRLRPDNLAGQIAMLVLAAILLFHLVVTTITHFGLLEGRPAPMLPGEVIANGFIALDVAGPSDRAAALAALDKSAPWLRFSVQDASPAAAEPASERPPISLPLWDDANIVGLGKSDDRPLGGVAVALRKGGWAIAAPVEREGAHDHPPLWRRLLARSVLFYFLCAALLTTWASRAVVAPLARLAREAERFPNDRCETRLIEQGPREVRELTRALNRMQDRIHTMIAARSHALAAISHDLRTIITRIRLRTEFIGEEALREKMLHDIELMDSMLYKNLQHLKCGAEAPEKSFIDLDSLLQTVSDQFADLGHDVSYRSGGRRVILGSMTGMQRVFNNLVENAVTYAKTVTITLHQPNAQSVCVEVADDGPGIAPQDRARMLEPFERGDAARNMNSHGGFGLGLSIVQSLVEEVGGGLQLLNREPHGLIARVTLPLAFAKE
ncbi:MAG TPA: ATP-binding protein [Methylocystis sp.]|nr:ATP-binding protein [Methylocystis sp.]